MFSQEPIGGAYPPWIPHNSPDYHLLRPEPHNVRESVNPIVHPAHLVPLVQVSTRLPDGLGSVPINPTTTRVYAGSNGHRLPPSQGYPPSQVTPLSHGQPLTQPQPAVHGNPTTITPAPQKPVQPEQNFRRSKRLLRAHNPIRGQKVNHPCEHEGGRGRTRGSPNYKRREIEKLLDLVEDKLPVASKGWWVIGLRFRDWALVSENPTRTDRSLELKFKQVCFPSVGSVWYGNLQYLAACQNEEANW